MSGKVEKQKRKEEEKKLEDYKRRRDEMNAELVTLSRKLMIDLKPIIRWGADGALPMLAFVDMADQYGALSEEAKKNNSEARKNKTTEEVVEEANQGDEPVLEL